LPIRLKYRDGRSFAHLNSYFMSQRYPLRLIFFFFKIKIKDFCQNTNIYLKQLMYYSLTTVLFLLYIFLKSCHDVTSHVYSLTLSSRIKMKPDRRRDSRDRLQGCDWRTSVKNAPFEHDSYLLEVVSLPLL